MNDTTAASAGFVLAGVALAACLVGWSGYEPAAILSGVALLAFALRRYGRLDRSIGPIVAGVAAFGVVVAALYAAIQGGGPLAAVLAAISGGGSAILAVADRVGLGREALVVRGIATAQGIFVGALGILGILAWYIVVGTVAVAVAPGVLENVTASRVLETLAAGAGTLTVVALYLWVSDRGLEFLDVAVPDLRGWAYAAGGTIAILGGNLAIGFAFQRVGVETAQHTIVQTAEADPTVLLALIPLSYLVIAPGEELLYRNVVQKSLREAFSPVAGVVVASAIFAAVHLPAYSSADQTLLSTINTLIIVFVLALILGAVYERTRNVVVSTLAHGTFNAIAFAAAYAQLTGAFGG